MFRVCKPIRLFSQTIWIYFCTRTLRRPSAVWEVKISIEQKQKKQKNNFDATQPFGRFASSPRVFFTVSFFVNFLDFSSGRQPSLGCRGMGAFAMQKNQRALLLSVGWQDWWHWVTARSRCNADYLKVGLKTYLSLKLKNLALASLLAWWLCWSSYASALMVICPWLCLNVFKNRN